MKISAEDFKDINQGVTETLPMFETKTEEELPAEETGELDVEQEEIVQEEIEDEQPEESDEENLDEEEAVSEDEPTVTEEAVATEEPAPVPVDPRELEQLRQEAMRAKILQDVMRNPAVAEAMGASASHSSQQQIAQAQAAVAAQRQKEFDDSLNDIQQAIKAIEAGDPDSATKMHAALAKRDQMIAKSIREDFVQAMSPFVSQFQKSQVDMSWERFCKLDPDLNAEYVACMQNPRSPSPIRDAMDEAMKSGEAGNWTGALKLAKAKLGKTMKETKQTTTTEKPKPKVTVEQKKAALAAASVGRSGKRVTMQKPTRLKTLEECYQEAISEEKRRA